MKNIKCRLGTYKHFIALLFSWIVSKNYYKLEDADKFVVFEQLITSVAILQAFDQAFIN